jgi:hypothetical protein
MQGCAHGGDSDAKTIQQHTCIVHSARGGDITLALKVLSSFDMWFLSPPVLSVFRVSRLFLYQCDIGDWEMVPIGPIHCISFCSLHLLMTMAKSVVNLLAAGNEGGFVP